jgi:AraC-like DNA-binding protein
MRCGFYDMSHFTRVFKQTMGMTPTQYRKGEEG